MTESTEPAPPIVRGPEFRGKRAATNSAVVGAGQVVVLLIALITTPVALSRIGLVEFGIWTFASYGVSLLTVIDPGFSTLVIRYGAQGRVRGDSFVAARVASVGSLVWLALGILGAPVVWLVTPWIVHFVPASAGISLGPSTRHAAIVFFYWSFAFVIFGSVQSILSGRLTAVGDQWLSTVIDVSSRVVYGIVAVVLLLRGWRLDAIIAATTAQFGLAYLATVVAVAVRDGRPYATPRGLPPALRKELWRFGGWLQLNSLLDTLTYETDPIVITFAIGAAINGIWSVASRLGRQVTYAGTIPQSNMLPAISAAHAAGEGPQALRRIYVRSQQIVVGPGALFAGIIIAFGPVILKAWLGRPYHAASVATILIALTMMAELPRPVTANTILATGRVGLGVRAQILGFVVNCVLTAALVVPFGLTGVLVGTLAAKTLATAYLLVRFSESLEVPLRDLVWPWLAPLLTVTAVTCVAGRLVMLAWPSAQQARLTSVIALVVLGGVFTLCYLAGLRITRFFSRDDLEWLRSVAPGPSRHLLHDRVISLLAGRRP